MEDSFLYGVKKIVCYTEDIVISRFHGNGSPSLMTKLNYHTRRNGHEKYKSKEIKLIC